MKRWLFALVVLLTAARPVFSQQDGFDLRSAQIYGTQVADWQIATSLDAVEFRDADPAGGVRPIFRMPWGEYTPDGWDGPITYSIYLFRKIDGKWHGACFLEFYRGKEWTGAPLHRQYLDWVNPGKGYGEMERLGNVQVGEHIAFMVTAGSQRLKNTAQQKNQPNSPRQRSNVIVVTYSTSGTATPLGGGGGTPAPQPTPQPTPPIDVAGLQRQIDELRAYGAELRTAIDENRAYAEQLVATQAERVTYVMEQVKELVARPVWASCEARANLAVVSVPIGCKLKP